MEDGGSHTEGAKLGCELIENEDDTGGIELALDLTENMQPHQRKNNLAGTNTTIWALLINCRQEVALWVPPPIQEWKNSLWGWLFTPIGFE